MFRKVNVYGVYGRTQKGNLILDHCGGSDEEEATKLFLSHYPGTEIEEVKLVGRGIKMPFWGGFQYKTYSEEELLRMGQI